MAKYETYEEILELGLFKEQQAHNFYTAMAQRAADPAIKKVFKDLAAEELEHKAKLEFELIKVGRVVKADSEPEEIDPADYVWSDAAELDIDYRDVLELAIAKEDAAFRLYVGLVAQASDSQAKETLLEMAQEEVRHKVRFEQERDRLLKTGE